MTSTTRTARCGPACRGGVGGERSGLLTAPIPIISAGVKESWENPKTREERLTRHGVEVYDGVVFVGKFTSTYQAFVALDLPINKGHL